MIKVARLSKIKEILLERGHADVTALSSVLNVSEVTVRSDLEQLEQEKFLRRTHGGAVLVEREDMAESKAFAGNDVDISNKFEKQYIAGIAADLVTPGSWVFIGPGTTCYLIGCALAQKKNVHIVTNNIYVALAFKGNHYGQLLLTGGNLNPQRMFLEGDLFFRSIENLHFSDAFFSVSGVSIENGLTVDGSEDIVMINRLRETCKRLIIAVDHNKFDQTGFMSVGGLDRADTIITNHDIPNRYKSFCYEHNIQLFTSYQLPHSAAAGGAIL